MKLDSERRTWRQPQQRENTEQEKKLSDVAVLTYTIYHCGHITIQLSRLVTTIHNWTVRQVNLSYYIPQRGTKQLAVCDSNTALWWTKNYSTVSGGFRNCWCAEWWLKNRSGMDPGRLLLLQRRTWVSTRIACENCMAVGMFCCYSHYITDNYGQAKPKTSKPPSWIVNYQSSKNLKCLN